MKIAIMGYAAAIILCARLPIIIYDSLLLAGVPVALYGLVRSPTRIVSAVFLGIVVAGHHAAAIRHAELPRALEAGDLSVTGYVSDLPQLDPAVTRFQLDLTHCRGCENVERITLSWYGAPEIRPGDCWRLSVRLNRPHGSVNAGLFDYEGWLFAHRIGARGYVRESPDNRRLGHTAWRVPHHQLRYRLREGIERAVDDPQMRGLLIALMLGESARISSRDWRILSNTGTNHLFVISGLHVGLVTALCYRLFLFTSGRRRLAGILSLVAACIYAAIAGMGLPVQRALIMTFCAMTGLILHRKLSAWDLFCFALLGVTLVDPLAPLGNGFWLSFGAVFSLLFAFGGQRYVRRMRWRWLAVAIETQWVAFIGMMPLLMCLVFQFSVASFLVNLIAIPWMAVLVVPPLLLATGAYAVAGPLFQACLAVAGGALELLWTLMTWAGEKQWVLFAGPLGAEQVILGMAGVLLALSPRGFMPRWPALVLVLPLFTTAPDVPERGGVDVSVLDVGQGLSVLMRTASGAVLYDAGPRYGSRFDAGERIVTPVLRRAGIGRLDVFVLSHTDNDHAGGVRAVLNNFPVRKIFSSDTDFMPGARPCRDGANWTLDEVHFRLIALTIESRRTNNRSCILLVQGRGFAILLPGDIEAPVERRLARLGLPLLDLIIAPHHGSRSSSTPGFLNRVLPDTVFVSAGYRNRFHHPDTLVLKRYRARHARVFVTAKEGELTMRLSPGGGLRLRRQRHDHPGFWYD